MIGRADKPSPVLKRIAALSRGSALHATIKIDPPFAAKTSLRFLRQQHTPQNCRRIFHADLIEKIVREFERDCVHYEAISAAIGNGVQFAVAQLRIR